MTGMRAVVIEDEFLLAQEIARELVSQGFDVVGMASNVKAALHIAHSEEIDIAILGVDLRGRQTDDVVRALVETGAHLVFVTGHSPSRIPNWVPPSMRFKKPIAAAALVSAIRTNLSIEGPVAGPPTPAATQPAETSILLALHDRLLREGLKRILNDGDFRVTESMPAGDLLEAARSTQAELIVIDPEYLTSDLHRDLQREGAKKPYLVVLAGSLDMDKLRSAIAAGVSGYLMKDISSVALKQSLRRIRAGELVLPSLLEPMQEPAPVPQLKSVPDAAGLSIREIQILAGLVDGQSNKLIGKNLAIAEGTVKAHIKSILKKIGVRNRTQGAIWAMAHGIAASARQAP